MKKRILALALACILILSVSIPVYADDIELGDLGIEPYGQENGVIWGICGDPSVNEGKNVSWLFDTDSGALILSGSGATADYASAADAPWSAFAESIRTLTVRENVAKIGSGISNGMTALTDVYFDGTQEQWTAVQIGTGNESLLAAELHFLKVQHAHVPVHHEAVTAGCTTAGNLEYWQCSECGLYFSDAACTNEIAANSWVVLATGHSFTNYVSDNNATCKDDGTKTAKCDNCTETDTITDVDSHLSVAHTSDGNTDCTKATLCTVCGATIKEAGTHTWNDGEITKQPTCTAKGEKTFTCTVCFATKTEDVDATGHSFTNYVSDNNATCKDDGTKTAACDHNCGETDTVTDVDSHLSVAHTSDGVTDCSQQSVCTVCATVLRAAGEHTWDNGSETLAPTCTAKGTMHYVCTVCSATKDEDINAKGHLFTTYVSDGNATCKDDGTKTAVCDHNCGETDTVTDVDSHLSVAHTSDGVTDCSQQSVCTVCATVLRAAGEHTWDNGTETLAPTCTAKGTMHYVCTVCSATKDEDIAAKGHDIVHHTAKAAGCTEVGWEAYDTCTRCDYSTYAEIPASGHSYENGVCTKCQQADPDYVPDEDCHIGEITVKDLSGNPQQTVPTGKSRVSFSLTNVKSTQSPLLMLAGYNSEGQFDGILWIQLEDVPIGATIRVTLPLDNTSGEITKLKLFAVSSDGNTTPLANAVTFGA